MTHLSQHGNRREEGTNVNDMVNEVLLEDRLVEIWPDYPCLYDVRSTDFKNRDMRQLAFEEMAKKLNKPGTYNINMKHVTRVILILTIRLLARIQIILE